jgi:hypothetical protein
MGVALSEVKTWQYNEFINYAQGYYDRLDNEWDIARTISFYCIAPYTKKIKSPRQLMRLRGEKKTTGNRAELAAEALKRVKAAEKRKNG